jgi:pSer/pThr/pTyr-binding forkhead associated (FHA) protein
VPVRIADITQRLQSVKKFLDPPLGPDAPPLEIRAAVVDAIEKQVVTLGLERRAFPYDRIVVRILAPHLEKTPLEKVFADLEARVRERLREIRCEVPRALGIRVSFMKKAPSGWTPAQLFSIDYGTRHDDVASTIAPSVPLLKVTVLKGTATRKVYVFREPIILIGRTAEPTDSKGRVRRNHVAFDDRNSTVSRAHARLKYDKARAEYRVLDEGSGRGTRIVRGETLMPVPRDPRGVRIRSGDEIQCGDASVRVTIE